LFNNKYYKLLYYMCTSKSLIIILLFFCMIILIAYLNKNRLLENFCDKPILWSYWENKKGKKMPAYIKLCYKTFKKNCADLYDIKILNEKTVNIYLPDLRKDINKLPLAQKSDYIRICLLYNYGGLWLDADTCVITNLSEILDKFNEGYNFIGFGCSPKRCIYGYPRPSNQAMASLKKTKLMKYCLDDLNKKLDDYFDNKITLTYFDLGKHIIWEQIEKLDWDEKRKYYHFPSYADGSRDKNGKWIVLKLLSKDKIDFIDINKIMIVFLANSYFCGNDPKYNWFCNLSEEEILNGDYNISTFFKYALYNNQG